MKISIQRPILFGSRKPATAQSVRPPRQPSSFRAALSTCMEEWKVDQAARGKITAVASPGPDERTTQQSTSGPLSRAWSWLQTKYPRPVAKRLRLSETLPLGEKRFVALVSVEGREFLIGGGASGVSMLAQLDKGTESGKGFSSNVNKASA
jgi:hypothetical protein